MTQKYIDQAKDSFKKAIDHLSSEFGRLQIGRANSSLVEAILVDSYGSKQPLKNIANISIPDPKTIGIQPWDKSMMGAVEKAIRDSDLGLNPVNNGDQIIISIPPMTEERRKDLVKVVHRFAEEAKISVRTARQDAHNKFKHLKSDGEITEDDQRGAEKRLQESVDKANADIEEMMKKKEKDVLTV